MRSGVPSRAWLLAILLTGLPAAAGVGPLVTLVGDQIPFEQALARIGQQLNRRFDGDLLADPAWRAMPYDFALDQATVGHTLDTLARLTGVSPARTSPTTYTFRRNVGARPTGPSETFDGWTVALSTVRYYLSSYYYPGDPSRSAVRAYLTPGLTAEAPSDGDALQLVNLQRMVLVTDDGREAAAKTTKPIAATPERSDPRLVQLSASVDSPGPAAESCRTVTVELGFAARVERTELVFDHLSDGAGRTVEADGCRGVLAARVAGQGATHQQVEVTVPIPEVYTDEQANGIYAQGSWLEGRFQAADGTPILTESRADKRRSAKGTWSAAWSFTANGAPWVGGPATAPATVDPERLVVSLYRPVGPVQSRTLVYHGVPLPARERRPNR